MVDLLGKIGEHLITDKHIAKFIVDSSGHHVKKSQLESVLGAIEADDRYNRAHFHAVVIANDRSRLLKIDVRALAEYGKKIFGTKPHIDIERLKTQEDVDNFVKYSLKTVD